MRSKGITEFSENWRRVAIVILKDLSLLASLYLAQFIVWRTLRARHKERIARKKNLRLISGGGPSPGIDKEMIVGTEEKERFRKAAQGPRKAAQFREISVTHTKDKERLARELGADQVVYDGDGFKEAGAAEVILATGNSHEQVTDGLSTVGKTGLLAKRYWVDFLHMMLVGNFTLAATAACATYSAAVDHP